VNRDDTPTPPKSQTGSLDTEFDPLNPNRPRPVLVPDNNNGPDFAAKNGEWHAPSEDGGDTRSAVLAERERCAIEQAEAIRGLERRLLSGFFVPHFSPDAVIKARQVVRDEFAAIRKGEA
jgi:hypothetical protein